MGCRAYQQGEELNISFGRPPAILAVGLVLVLLGALGVARPTLAAELPTQYWDVVGLACLVAGMLTSTFRTGAVLNRSRNSVKRWVGFGLPIVPDIRLFQRRHDLTPHYVHLGSETDLTKRSTVTWYPITLVGESENITFGKPEAVMQAWSVAQAIATYFAIQLVDETESLTVTA